MILLKMSSEHKCTLTQLYASAEVKMLIREKLTEVFKYKFAELLKEASAFRPFLVRLALFKHMLKCLFIEEGQQINSIEDLEFVLYKMNFLKITEFRKAKQSFEESIQIEKSIKGIKRLSFDI